MPKGKEFKNDRMTSSETRGVKQEETADAVLRRRSEKKKDFLMKTHKGVLFLVFREFFRTTMIQNIGNSFS